MNYNADEITPKIESKAREILKEIEAKCVVVIAFDVGLHSFTSLVADKTYDVDIVVDGIKRISAGLLKTASKLENEQQIQE
jgi:uncharacterized protein YccT (UPF0319 family)